MELKNRWIMLAMHTGYANADGSFSQRDFEFYRRRAAGGMAAITLVGAVNEEGEQERMHRLDKPECEPGIREVCDIIHFANTRVIMQLFHAGRNKRITEEQQVTPIAPSDIPSPIYRTEPRVMTEEDINRTIRDFAVAAKRCKDCGVDAVEVSVSAGYLLTQFLSPLTNKRTDSWGGDDKARMSFPTAVLTAIRKEVSQDYPVIIKISGGDMLGGYDLQYMADFINQLPAGTINGVTVTGGWHEAPVPQMTFHVAEGAFSGLAGEIRRKTGLPVITCNRNHSQEIAEEILERGDADFVGVARPFLTDPYFARKLQNGIKPYPCQACNKGCIERVLKGKDVECAFNPEAGKEYLRGEVALTGKNVLVAGAGPIGMMAAVYAARNGNRVTLVTRDKKVGGRLNIACKPPHKQGLADYIDVAYAELQQLGARVETGVTLTRDNVLDFEADVVVLALGAKPIMLSLPGLKSAGEASTGAGAKAPRTYTADEVLAAPSIELGNRIVIVGGGSVGLETAEYIAANLNPDGDKHITVIEMAEKAGKDLGGIKWIMMKSLKSYGVKVITSAKLDTCTEEGIFVEKDDKKEFMPADTLVFAVGSRPNRDTELENFLTEKGIPYHIVGDMKKPANVMSGLADLYEMQNCKTR